MQHKAFLKKMIIFCERSVFCWIQRRKMKETEKLF